MTDYTEAGPKDNRKNKKRKWNVKKYSKKWWTLYRKQERRKKVVAARRRASRARQILLARQNGGQTDINEQPAAVKSVEKTVQSRQRVSVQENSPVLLPSGEAAPQTWKRGTESSNELQYSVNDENGNQMGSASLSVVGTATGADADTGRSKTLGGVSTGALRRTVIDKMIKEEGWVVNDYQKEVNGKKVYVVVAQSSVGGALQSRLFYFTEVDGRIYSLATAAPKEAQERLAQESEKVINSLQRTNRSVQAGLK